MFQAKYKDKVVAQSSNTISVEGNEYFPRESVNFDLIKDSSTHTVCGWKGTASYYDVVVDGETLKDAAWYYPQPLDEAKNIKDYVAFYDVVTVNSISPEQADSNFSDSAGSALENGITEGSC